MRGKNIQTLARELNFQDPKPLSLALKAFVESEKISRHKFAKADDSTILKIARSFVKEHAQNWWGTSGRRPYYKNDSELILTNLNEILIRQRRNTFDSLQAYKRKHGIRDDEPEDFDDLENEDNEPSDAMSDTGGDASYRDTESTRSVSIVPHGSSLRSNTDERPTSRPILGGTRSPSRGVGEHSLSQTPVAVNTGSPRGTQVTRITLTTSDASGTRKRKFDQIDTAPVSHVASHAMEAAAGPMEIGRRPVALSGYGVAAPGPRSISEGVHSRSKEGAGGAVAVSVREVACQTEAINSAVLVATHAVASQTDTTNDAVPAATCNKACQTDSNDNVVVCCGDYQYSVDQSKCGDALSRLLGQFQSVEHDTQLTFYEALKKGIEKDMSEVKVRLELLKQIRKLIRPVLLSTGALEE